MATPDSARDEDPALSALRSTVERQAADLEMVAEAADQMDALFRSLAAATVAAAAAPPPPDAAADPISEPDFDSLSPFDFARLYT